MTKQIRVGKLKIGGGAPVVIQSMAKTDTRNVSSTVREIKGLERIGCELVRLAVKDVRAADAIKPIRKKINIPVCADIHYDYRLAVRAIENGADKIRLNPGNIYKEEQIIEVARLAKKRHVPIRVGVNSGSVDRLRAQGSGLRVHRTHSPDCPPWREPSAILANALVSSAIEYIKILEKAKFYDIIVSLKASDVRTTIDAYRRFAGKSKYPLHLGVTAAGPVSTGLVKSSIGIGALLLEGIGDTIRVSLTGDPCQEVIAAKNILQALNLRRFGPEIISCPTCGRCQVDLQDIVKEIERRLSVIGNRLSVKGYPKVAIMGCEVNGPGEAREADIGIACGKNSGVLFKKGRILRRIREKDIVKELLHESRTTNHEQR